MDSALKPTLEDVTTLLANGNCVPVFSTIFLDLLTPVSAYLKLAQNEPYSFLFESVASGEKLGRFSFLGITDETLRVGDNEQHTGDPLVYIEEYVSRVRYVRVEGLPDFTGGAVGFIAYDAVRHFEPHCARRERLDDSMEFLPEAMFLFCDSLVVFDHLHHVAKVVAHVRLDGAGPFASDAVAQAYAHAAERIESLTQRLESAAPVPLPPQGPITLGREYTSNIGAEGYKQFVRTLKEHIVAGDIIQAVPSQRVRRPTDLHPFNMYRHLRSINPSPYMFYVHMGDFQLIGASPECLAKVVDGKVTTFPIAGTRKRGRNAAHDDALAAELVADPKERSEHIMLVDLGRNDVNRVCRPETVKVDALMRIERYSHVMHIVSEVSGQLRPNLTPFDAFKSIFPAGTVSGAPKIMAVGIVGELEQERRGVYAGAVGYFGLGGTIDTCIAIRTMVFHKGTAYLQAGGGIVYDSDEQSEWEETMNKLRGNLTAIDRAERHYYALQQKSNTNGSGSDNNNSNSTKREGSHDDQDHQSTKRVCVE